MFKKLMLVSAMVLMSGCAAYTVRFTDDYKDPKPVYPATCADIGEFISIADYGWWYVGLPLFLDVPFSLVTDTVCLPYDIVKMGVKK